MSQRHPSVLINAVGAINVLIGLAFIGFGVYALVAGAEAVASLFDLQRGVDQVADKHNAPGLADASNIFTKGLSGIILAMVGIVAGCSIVQGLPALLVGVGVIWRSNLARIFAIVFALLALLEGLACLSSAGQSNRILMLGLVLIAYAIVSFVALFGRRASFEFSGGLKRAAPSTEAQAMNADVPPRSEAPSQPTAPAIQTVLLVATSAMAAIFATLYFMRPPTPPIVVPGPPPAVNEPRAGTVGTAIIVGKAKPNLVEFHDAVVAGQIPRAAELLKDIDVDEPDEQGRTALMKVAASGNRRMAMFLLGMGAQLNQGDKTGRTPFMYAVDKDQIGIIEVFRGDAAIVAEISALRAQYKSVSKDGVNLNMKELIANFTLPTLNYNARDKTGQNAYMQAFLKGHFEAAKLAVPPGTFFQFGTKDVATDSQGNSLLHLLIADGDWKKVRLINPPDNSNTVNNIWRYGWLGCCDPKQTNGSGQEPWMLAAEKGPLEIVKHLLPAPTLEDLQRKDITGKTGADVAAAAGNTAVAAYLTQLEAELTKKAAEAKKTKDGEKKK